MILQIIDVLTNATSISVQTLVIVHVQKAMNELSSVKIVVQLPSVSNVITLNQHLLSRPQLSR